MLHEIYLCRPIDVKKFDNGVVRETARTSDNVSKRKGERALVRGSLAARFRTGRITYGSRNYR